MGLEIRLKMTHVLGMLVYIVGAVFQRSMLMQY